MPEGALNRISLRSRRNGRKGGELAITYRDDGTVLMRGPAATVFDGVIEYE